VADVNVTQQTTNYHMPLNSLLVSVFASEVL